MRTVIVVVEAESKKPLCVVVDHLSLNLDRSVIVGDPIENAMSAVRNLPQFRVDGVDNDNQIWTRNEEPRKCDLVQVEVIDANYVIPYVHRIS